LHLNDHETASSSKKRPQANRAPRRVKEISFVIVDLKFYRKALAKVERALRARC
jgi:hypothetical protein